MKFVVAIFVLCVVASTATSAVEVYFGEDLGVDRQGPTPNADAALLEWRETLEASFSEDFESFPPNATADLLFDLGPIESVLTGYGYVRSQPSGTYVGTYPTTGEMYWLADNPTEPFTIVFDSPQQAVGFYATDVGDIGAQLIVESDAGHQITVPSTVDGPSGSVLFFGIVDEENLFTQISIVPEGWSADGFGIDDIWLGWRPGAVSVDERAWSAVKNLFAN